MKKLKEKTTEIEKLYYVNGDYKGVLRIRVNVISFSFEGILYLYKSCQG